MTIAELIRKHRKSPSKLGGKARTLSENQLRKIEEVKDLLDTFTAELDAILKANQPAHEPYGAGLALTRQMQHAEGGAWTGAELERRFGLSPATLHRRRKEHRVIFWRDAQHEFHYPKCQFTPAGALLPGIQEVLQILNSQDEWRVMRYFLANRVQFGNRRPLDLLREGEVERLLEHAKVHAEENTW